MLAAGELPSEPVEPDGAIERAKRHLYGRVELVQVPAQPLLAAPPFRDQIVAVIDEQLQLTQAGFLRPRPVEARFAQGGAGDGERVEPVRLATRPAAATLRSGQPRRHTHQALAGDEQQLLEPACHMPTVLDRPEQPPVSERARPPNQLVLNRAASLSKRAAELVDGDRRQRVLVHVHSDHDH